MMAKDNTPPGGWIGSNSPDPLDLIDPAHGQASERSPVHIANGSRKDANGRLQWKWLKVVKEKTDGR